MTTTGLGVVAAVVRNGAASVAVVQVECESKRVELKTWFFVLCVACWTRVVVV